MPKSIQGHIQTRTTSAIALFLTTCLLALTVPRIPAAFADGTEPKPPPLTWPGDSIPPSSAPGLIAENSAEKAYAKGWKLAQEAKKKLAEGKTDAAKKRFAKALEEFDEATRFDPDYYQAWNMVGFCARKSGDLKRAFAGYERCLSIAPDYEEAHEYLGEAYLMSGDLAKAKEQLAWLRSRNSDEAEELAEKVAEFEKGAASARGRDSSSTK